jgi:hypothetical protein
MSTSLATATAHEVTSSIVIPSKFYLIPSFQIWWPAEVGSIMALLNQRPVVSLMQCRHPIARQMRQYVFRCRPFHTVVIDLKKTEQELLQAMRKSTRSLIGRGQRLDPSISVNADTDEALELINGFIRQRKFRRPIARQEWSSYLPHCDVFQIAHGGEVMAVDVVLKDFPRRARAVFGATADREGAPPSTRAVIGALNRRLVWHQIQHYKALSFEQYDLGGVTLESNSAVWSISDYKLSFGGEAINELVVHATADSRLRTLFKVLAAARDCRSQLRGWHAPMWTRPVKQSLPPAPEVVARLAAPLPRRGSIR